MKIHDIECRPLNYSEAEEVRRILEQAQKDTEEQRQRDRAGERIDQDVMEMRFRQENRDRQHRMGTKANRSEGPGPSWDNVVRAYEGD